MTYDPLLSANDNLSANELRAVKSGRDTRIRNIMDRDGNIVHVAGSADAACRWMCAEAGISEGCEGSP